jgi:hypothetical protein
MTAIMLQDLGRTVSVEELRSRVTQIDIKSGLNYLCYPGQFDVVAWDVGGVG